MPDQPFLFQKKSVMKRIRWKVYLWITSKIWRKMSYKNLVIQFQKFHEAKIAALERFIDNEKEFPLIKITKKESDAIEFVVGFKTYLLVIEPILDKEGLIQNSYAFYKTYKVTRDLEHYGNQKLTLESTLRLSGGGGIMIEANAKPSQFDLLRIDPIGLQKKTINEWSYRFYGKFK